MIGAADARIMFRHVLRNATRTLPLIFTLNCSEAHPDPCRPGLPRVRHRADRRRRVGLRPEQGAVGCDQRHLVDRAVPRRRHRARGARHHARRREPERPRRSAAARPAGRGAGAGDVAETSVVPGGSLDGRCSRRLDRHVDRRGGASTSDGLEVRRPIVVEISDLDVSFATRRTARSRRSTGVTLRRVPGRGAGRSSASRAAARP